MIRKAIIVVLTASSVGTAALWADSYRVRQDKSWGPGTSVEIRVGERDYTLQVSAGVLTAFVYDDSPRGSKVTNWAIRFGGLGVQKSSIPVLGINATSVRLPFWFALLVFSWYPTFTFIRGPFRRWRRRRKGCCLACGYDLQGNLSGVCPECGVAT